MQIEGQDKQQGAAAGPVEKVVAMEVENDEELERVPSPQPDDQPRRGNVEEEPSTLKSNNGQPAPVDLGQPSQPQAKKQAAPTPAPPGPSQSATSKSKKQPAAQDPPAPPPTPAAADAKKKGFVRNKDQEKGELPSGFYDEDRTQRMAREFLSLSQSIFVGRHRGGASMTPSTRLAHLRPSGPLSPKP